ncbi:MAG: S-adenosylmethionine decarboxylase family protein [Pseudolabrys sp.]
MLMTHLLAEFYGCNSAMEDEGALVAAARTAAEEVGATVIGNYELRYVPHGLTVAVFLAESHIVLTTWPEFRLTLLDVLLCNPTMDHNRVAARIKERICPDGRMVVHEVPRMIAMQP